MRNLIEVERHTPTAWHPAATQLRMAARRPRAALSPVVRSRAPLLPLRLGRLTASAIAPTFIILFTDEFWWAAIHLQRWSVWGTIALAILTGTVFVLGAQRLQFPGDYISAWFDGRFDVGVADHFYLALIVASLGTLTGALGGSFHGRSLLREYGLFLEEP